MVLNLFCAANIFMICKRSRAPSQGDKIIPIWQVFHGKKIGKDMGKIKYSKHECMNPWAWF